VVRKYAFTLIELIFAIVLIAISVLSLPMLNQVIAKNVDTGLTQEAIFAAATEINEAMTAHWDDNSIDPNAPQSYARVIDNGLCDNNISSLTYRLMPGHITEVFHRRCLDSNTTTAANTNSNANVESLDDKKHGATNIFTTSATSAQGYKENYKSKLSVTTNPIFGGAQNSQMKKIEVTITKDDGTVVTKLVAYSANIGEVDYYKKAY